MLKVIKDKKVQVDPLALAHKKFRAKCHFRALARLVIANAYWLLEDIPEYEGVDVKRRVAQAIYGKAKKKQLLSITDKALLNKPASDRTETEKRYLYRILGGLSCFKKYPNQVKKKLAAVTYFKYYGPGRVIVREGQVAQALYFVVSGDVIASHMVYDELLHQMVSEDIAHRTSGDMFGEISLLHNIPRVATCTTASHCEFLALKKDNFSSILQSTVQKEWDEVRRAMLCFTYFDHFDQIACREGSTVAKLKTFKPNEIILGDDVGITSYVHFILTGQCQMIESLDILVTNNLGHTSYTLHDSYVRVESEQDIDVKYFKNYRETTRSSYNKPSTIVEYGQSSKCRTGSKRLSITKDIVRPRKLSTGSSFKSYVSSIYSDQTIKSTKVDKSITSLEEQLLSVEQEPRHSVRYSLIPEIARSRNLKRFFMQVCIFNPGATFGFGENMRDRRIVSLTRTHVMLLPKVWLLHHNPANIWTRIQHYLEKTIPTKDQLFEMFVDQCHWRGHHKKILADVKARSNAVNWTTKHDVPLSVRIEETINI